MVEPYLKHTGNNILDSNRTLFHLGDRVNLFVGGFFFGDCNKGAHPQSTQDADIFEKIC